MMIKILQFEVASSKFATMFAMGPCFRQSSSDAPLPINKVFPSSVAPRPSPLAARARAHPLNPSGSP